MRCLECTLLISEVQLTRCVNSNAATEDLFDKKTESFELKHSRLKPLMRTIIGCKKSSLLRIMINFRSIISGTMTAALSNNNINKSGATAFWLTSASPTRPLTFVLWTQGASPLSLVNTYGRHHAIILRVDHYYGYLLRCPQVLSERRMYNERQDSDLSGQSESSSELKRYEHNGEIPRRKRKTVSKRLEDPMQKFEPIALPNSRRKNASKEVKSFTALEQTVETRKEDSNDRECIVVTDLLKNPTDQKHLRRCIESTRQTETTKEDFIINRIWETSGGRKCLRDRRNRQTMVHGKDQVTLLVNSLPFADDIRVVRVLCEDSGGDLDTQICEDYCDFDTATK
ncbi:hypothetical protein IW262DRAFT_1294679 [Armillaria fumosa]|nr:hypothetical protein IW262DRAFT_1294679 [Armillaria fumosa]